MKKLPALFLAIWMVLSLCSCTTAVEPKAAEKREQQRWEIAKRICPFFDWEKSGRDCIVLLTK